MATPADSPVNPVTGDPALARLMAAARRSLERTGGDLSRTIGLTELTDAERRAVGGLLGRHITAGTKRVEINLEQVDTRLRTLSGHGLADTLGHDKPLRNRPAEAAQDKAAREKLLATAHTSLLHHQDWFSAWIEEIRGNGTFTRLLKTPARLGYAIATLELIDTLDGSTITLPKLATRATGHSHALDHRTPLSALVLDALASRINTPRPTTTEQRRELWDHFNVIVDDLASTALVLNLPATGTGLGDWLTSSATTATPFHITLHQILTHSFHLAPPRVYVCENPAVLREASDVLGPACPPLICTQGQPSTAFHRLATKITNNGGQLHYHGDFDWPGIAMTTAITNRHNAQPWRMTTAEYISAVDHTSSDHEPAIGGLKGDPEPTPWDPPLSGAMIRLNHAIYEEAVVDMLIADLSDHR